MTPPAHGPTAAADPLPAPVPHTVRPSTFGGRPGASADRSRARNGGRGRP